MKSIIALLLFSVSINNVSSAQDLPPVPEDEVGIIEKLQTDYPPNWIYASGVGFPQNGRLMIIDIADPTWQYKGGVAAGYLADFVANDQRGEFYISETYYERGSRGKRNDMITVYDQETLTPKAEIPLDAGKRFLVMPMEGKFSLINDRKWAVVSNYTPATSVTVVDLENQKILSEIPIPGCNLAYRLGKKGFATMCGYGEVISIQLDENGEMISEVQSEPFNNLDDDPHFEKVTRVDDVMYMPTYKGNITPIDLSGVEAKLGKTWSLVSDKEKEQGWRPGGWQIISSDRVGNIYVLMHENGYNGSHKDQGSEVWVFDPVLKERIARHKLRNKAYSIVVTKEDKPHLVTSDTDNEMLEVYDAKSGDYSHKIQVGALVPIMYASE